MHCDVCDHWNDEEECHCEVCDHPLSEFSGGEFYDDDSSDWGDSAYYDAEGQFRDDDYYP